MKQLKSIKIINFIAFVCIIFAPPSVSAQQLSLKKTIDSLSVVNFTSDNLKNIYIITTQNEVIKYDAETGVKLRFSDKKLGKIGLIDASNPFMPLVFYPDFQTVILLNRQLIPQQTIRMSDIGVVKATNICVGDEGSIWIYDEGIKKLRRFVREGNIMTQKVAVIINFADALPTQMIYRNNVLYINIPNKGILTFDSFAKFVRKLDIQNVTYMQVIEGQLIYRKDWELFRFNLQSLATLPMKVPDGTHRDDLIRIERNQLCFLKKDVIQVYYF